MRAGRGLTTAFAALLSVVALPIAFGFGANDNWVTVILISMGAFSAATAAYLAAAPGQKKKEKEEKEKEDDQQGTVPSL